MYMQTKKESYALFVRKKTFLYVYQQVYRVASGIDKSIMNFSGDLWL